MSELTKLSFIISKAYWQFSFHLNTTPFFYNALSGSPFCANPAINFLKYEHNPKNERNLFKCSGIANSLTASTLTGSGAIPCSDTRMPS